MGRGGPGRVGPSMPERASSDDGWEHVPITVLAVVCLSFLFTLARVRPVGVAEGSPVAVLFNLLQLYTLNMFMHAGPAHVLGNMFMFVLFGGALTVLTNNRHVLFVVLVSHVCTSIYLHAVEGSIGIGASLALAGVIAATTVRALAMVVGAVDRDGPIGTVFGGAFALFVLALFGLLSMTGLYYLRIFDHHFGGWVFGALAELAWIAWDRVCRS